MTQALAQLVSSETMLVIGFLVAMIPLDTYDVFLPRGEGVSISGPLAGALIVLASSPAVVVVPVSSIVLVHSAYALSRHRWSGTSDLGIRVAATLAAVILNGVAVQGVTADARLVLVPAIYLLVEFVLRQAEVAKRQGRPILSLITSTGSQQALFLAAQLSTSALTVATYSMGVWSLVPVVALLLLMRQTFAMLLELRETYLSTVSILIEAAEAQKPGLAGHSERTARIAREIGARCALTSPEIETVEYAALLHDVGRISAAEDIPAAVRPSSEVIRDVEFLTDVVPVLQLIDGDGILRKSERQLMSAFIVALASEIDSDEGDVVDRHGALARLAALVPGRIKAAVVGAALELGYPVPAID